uniref:TBP-binding domain-containing protein n=1 Tax=Rhabditophanes sp. KR3021 TaxID=114890 RepID=A0AC35TYA6_9BILA
MGIFESTYDKIEEYLKNLDKDLMDSTDECDEDNGEENEDDVEDSENEETEEKQHREDSDVDSEGDEIENGDLDSKHGDVNMEVDLTKLEMFELNLKSTGAKVFRKTCLRSK